MDIEKEINKKSKYCLDYNFLPPSSPLRISRSVSLFYFFSFLVFFLAAGEADFGFYFFAQRVDVKRDERKAFFLRFAGQIIYFFLVSRSFIVLCSAISLGLFLV